MWLLQCLKTPVLEHPLRVNVSTCQKHSWNLHGTTFIRISQDPQENWARKHLSLRSEISRLFGNTLTADNMYSRHNWEKFSQCVQMPLSQKRQTFSAIFIRFLQSTQNLANFEKKNLLQSLNIWEVIETEKCCYLNARKLLFYNTLQESVCSPISNTAKICTAARFS